MAKVGWDQLRNLGLQIPNTKINLTNREIVLPNNSVIVCKSADNPDRLRGQKLHFLVIDEAALVDESTWVEVLRPSLADTRGRALFISTPRQGSWFQNLYNLKSNEWSAHTYTTYTNPNILASEIDSARASMTDRGFRQEFLAEFLPWEDAVFSDFEANIILRRTENQTPDPTRTYYAGVDLGRRCDSTVATVLDDLGTQVAHASMTDLPWAVQTRKIVDFLAPFDAQVSVDSTGIGDPIAEELQTLLPGVTTVRFGQQSKVSIIDSLALKLEKHQLKLMDIPTQTTQLSQYRYTTRHTRGGTWRTSGTGHDDYVCALALAVHAQDTALGSTLTWL